MNDPTTKIQLIWKKIEAGCYRATSPEGALIQVAKYPGNYAPGGRPFYWAVTLWDTEDVTNLTFKDRAEEIIQADGVYQGTLLEAKDYAEDLLTWAQNETVKSEAFEASVYPRFFLPGEYDVATGRPAAEVYEFNGDRIVAKGEK
jgi:hypothetical protein